MRIACIGDSCTYGQNVRADQAWPHILWELTGHDVRNLGVNGDTSRLGLERWHRDVDLMDPDVVVIQFGHNDANIWDNHPRVLWSAFKGNIHEMEQRAPRAIILSPWPAKPERQAGYNDRLQLYRHVRTIFPDILDDGYGVHPSPEGHREIAEHVKALL